MKINIIGDIAGRFDEFMLLLERMPDADLILSVGDLMDRGPKSPEVIDWFMKTENADSLYGNHEDLFVKANRGKNYKDVLLWRMNGGNKTLESYKKIDKSILEKHVDWVSKRPVYFQTEDLFVSHAPCILDIDRDFLPNRYFKDEEFVWNRVEPLLSMRKYMFYGHNGEMKKLYDINTGEDFSMCIDDSRSRKLTGIHWPSREIFQQKYLM